MSRVLVMKGCSFYDVSTKKVTLSDNVELYCEASPSSYGTVTGSGVYSTGTSVTLTATAVSGYLFDGWNDGETNSTRTVEVGDVPKTYIANFIIDQEYNPAATPQPNTYNWGKGGIVKAGESSGSTNPTMSMISPDGTNGYYYTDVAITLIAALNYKISARVISSNQQVKGTGVIQSEYWQTTTPSQYLDTLEIPANKYYQVAVTLTTSGNSNTEDGANALLVVETQYYNP